MDSPWEAFQEIANHSHSAFFLDSVTYHPPDQRYSYIGSQPFLEVAGEGDVIRVSGAEHGNYPLRDFFPLMRKLLLKYKPKAQKKKPHFTGGAVGFLSYEMASQFEAVSFRKKQPSGLPLFYFGFYREVQVFDHKIQWPMIQPISTEQKEENEFFHPPFQPRVNPSDIWRVDKISHDGPVNFHVENFRPEISRGRFLDRVRQAKKYIAQGDIYQANLSQRFIFDFEGSALDLYDDLRQINPSPFSSFFKIGNWQIVSSSPERLIKLRDRDCETRPIAGTKPRPKSKLEEKEMIRELKANEKERAEHIMLVDLERNDLGRVCDFHSVKVREMMKVEKYSHVLHLVSKITGKLRQDKDVFDLLRAVFPGGTITGCPKIRCMEIIDELESTERGIYTGSIGYIDFDGNADFNIVIRTLVLHQNQGILQVGAGIVHDSDPAKEYEETLHKGEAMAQALTRASL